MKEIRLRITQSDVNDEVAKITDYTGSKLVEADEGARDRILMSDGEQEDMKRFWEETAQAVNENLKELLSGDTPIMEEEYNVALRVGNRWNDALLTTANSILRSFFIASIVGQWFKFVNAGEAADYFSKAAELMQSLKQILYSRQRPPHPANYSKTEKEIVSKPITPIEI